MRTKDQYNGLIGIYRIVNLKNGYSYIGQSKNIYSRFLDHMYKKTENPRMSKIDRAIINEGVTNFLFQVLEICKPEDLDWKEDYYIKYYQSVDFGYNEVFGGQNNIGESNSNSKLTYIDVFNIREAYKNHQDPEAIYRSYFMTKISLATFFTIWEGKTWNEVHMDVYTEDNKAYYKSLNHNRKEYTNFSDDEIMRFRQRYVNESAIDIYKSEGITCRFNTFRYILTGGSYKHLPIYNKNKKVWIQL